MAFIDIDVTKNIKTIDCWMQGEKNAEGVHFDISTWIETYGAGTAYIYIRRNGDETAYFRAMEVTDGVAEWLFSAADTAKAGDGRAQAVYITTDESVVKKTNWYHTTTAESEGDPTGEDPDPYKEMATEVIARMEEAEEELTEQALGEISDAKDEALEDIQDTMFNLAPEFVTTASYSSGDIVLYIGNLYEFTANHAAGAWIGTDARQITIGGVVADLKEELAGKPNWTVGSAEQIVSDEASQTDVTPYTFRRSGGGLIPFSFTREELAKVVGGTVAWNQLCNGSSVTVANGHKYYMLKGGTASVGASDGTAITGLTSGTDMVTDLSLALGTTIADYVYSLETATAGSGIAKLKEWGFFRDSYYAYDAGSLQSVCVGAHSTTGKNLLNVSQGEGAVSGTVWTNNNGVLTVTGTVNSTVYRIIGSFKTEKGVQYTLTGCPTGGGANKYRMTMVGYGYDYGNGYTFTGDGESHDVSCDVYTGQTLPLTFKPMIRFSSADATYVPYAKHTYALDSTKTLRGIPKLDASNNLYYDGDTYESDGTVTRNYGIVDLGTLDWSAGTDATGQYFYSPSLTSAKSSASSSAIANVICEKYVASSSWAVSEKNIAVSSGANPTLYVRDTTYNDATAFKTAMSGIYLVYELATPTTETADPYTAVQICDSDGTEEFVDALVASGDRDVAIPAGTETTYFEDMAGKLADLPPIPSAPSANGTYTLQAVVSSGSVTYQWTS